MENFSKNDFNDENEESKKIVDNFKNELEKIKQKLGKNYEQNSQVVQGKNNKNFHYIDKNKIEPKEKKVIEFDGNSWQLVDPTFASNNESSDVADYVGDGTNYLLKYSY